MAMGLNAVKSNSATDIDAFETGPKKDPLTVTTGVKIAVETAKIECQHQR